MKVYKLNSSGFAHMAIIVAVVALLSVGGVGWVVFSKNRNSGERASIAESSQNDSANNLNDTSANEEALDKQKESDEESNNTEDVSDPAVQEEPEPVQQPVPVVVQPQQQSAPDYRPTASTCVENGYDASYGRVVDLYVSNKSNAGVHLNDPRQNPSSEPYFYINYGEKYTFECNNYDSGESLYPYFSYDGYVHRDDLSTIKP